MQHWADYLIFVCFVLTSLGIGVYHAVTGGKQRTTEEFIMANRQLSLIPTALSILMSYQSAISIIGGSAEIYSFGTQAWLMWILGFSLAIILAERFFIPWLYPLKLTSVNKYFQMRYGDQEIQAFAAVVGIMSAILYMGVAMFAPAVALETATGFPTMASIPVMSVVCVIYTSLGGMKAVIWTDVFQTVVTIGGMLAVLIKGMISINGGKVAFELLGQEERLTWIDFSPDPRTRQTIWAYIFGWSTQWACIYGLQQAGVQRYSALPTLKKARLSLLLNIPSLAIFQSLTNLIGITVFAYYTFSACDPLVSGRIGNPNELLPYFVKEIFTGVHGFAGLFLATLFSGALSSVSSSLSGSAANAWEDIISPHMVGVSQYRAAIINKVLVVVIGLSATGISFLSALMTGPITQIALAFFGACGGPLLGLFLISGISCLDFVRSRAVLIASIIAFGVNLWISIGAGFVKGKYPTFPPITVEGCDPPLNDTVPDMHQISGIDHLYSVSFLWYTPIGCLITLLLGIVMSAIMNCAIPVKKREVDEKLFIPFKQIFNCRKSPYNEVPASDKNNICVEHELKEDIQFRSKPHDGTPEK